jgi:hypothetical protein
MGRKRPAGTKRAAGNEFLDYRALLAAVLLSAVPGHSSRSSQIPNRDGFVPLFRQK